MSLDDYEKLMMKANTIERKDKKQSIVILQQCLTIIDSDPAKFAEKFPNRKFDKTALEKRLGLLKEKVAKEEGGDSKKDQQKRDNIIAEIQEEMKKSDDFCDQGKYNNAMTNLNYAMKLAKTNSINEQIPVIEVKLNQIAEMKGKNNENLAELEKLIAETKKHQEQHAFSELIPDCEKVVQIAINLRNKPLQSKYDGIIVETKKLLEFLKTSKDDIQQLRTKAQDSLDKGSINDAKGFYGQTLDKVQALQQAERKVLF